MRFRIHRGATVIGGSCIEVQSGGKSLLLDLGLPLEAGKPDRALLPPVAGLVDGNNPDLLGILISHPHSDHYGLLEVVHPLVPVYIGDGARRLLEVASAFTTGKNFAQPVTTYHNRGAFNIGPFRVTPYLMDHSAFDAYALLIEADGQRLLYSGDFRAHGRKAWAFDAFLADPPASIDVLLMEGTVLGREASPPRSRRIRSKLTSPRRLRIRTGSSSPASRLRTSTGLSPSIGRRCAQVGSSSRTPTRRTFWMRSASRLYPARYRRHRE